MLALSLSENLFRLEHQIWGQAVLDMEPRKGGQCSRSRVKLPAAPCQKCSPSSFLKGRIKLRRSLSRHIWQHQVWLSPRNEQIATDLGSLILQILGKAKVDCNRTWLRYDGLQSELWRLEISKEERLTVKNSSQIEVQARLQLK